MLVALPPINENISFAINRQFSMLDEDHYHVSYRHHLNAKHFLCRFILYNVHQQLILIN